MPTVSESKSKDKVKALRARIDDSVEALARAVDEVRASETFRAYLDMQAKFHRYSWCNSMLIMSQKPDATQVAGYRTWQKMKRQVCKGERGIMIFAPCPWAKEQEKPNGETETVSGMFFRAVHVFDVSQTDGPDLPTVDVPNVETVADGLLADDPTFMASLENERLALEDDVSDFKAYPVISLSFVYNF